MSVCVVSINFDCFDIKTYEKSNRVKLNVIEFECNFNKKHVLKYTCISNKNMHVY